MGKHDVHALGLLPDNPPDIGLRCLHIRLRADVVVVCDDHPPCVDQAARHAFGIEGVANDRGGKNLPGRDYPRLAAPGQFSDQTHAADEGLQLSDDLLNFTNDLFEQLRSGGKQLPRQVKMPLPKPGKQCLHVIIMLSLCLLCKLTKHPGDLGQCRHHDQRSFAQSAPYDRDHPPDRRLILDGRAAEFHHNHTLSVKFVNSLEYSYVPLHRFLYLRDQDIFLIRVGREDGSRAADGPHRESVQPRGIAPEGCRL